MKQSVKYLVWDDLEFATGCINIKPGRIKEILQPIPFKGAMASLNAIKQEYFVRKYNKPIKLVFIDSRLSKELSPCWAEINDLIEKAIEIHRFATVEKTVLKKKAAPKKTAVKRTVVTEEKEKPDYLKILASLQSDKYRLITISEKYGGQSEESHIYRFDTLSGRILIVWENTKASRAAYLFIADEASMSDRLSKIEAFINTENISFKRSRFQNLRQNKPIRAELHFIGSIHHEGVSQFQTDIKTYLNRY